MTAPARKLSADDVFAFSWSQVCEQTRGALCALSNLPTSYALLEWFELGDTARTLLRREIADLIEHNASRQRAEWAQGVAA